MSPEDKYKNRIKQAVEKFHEKDLKEINRLQGLGRKNKKPEKLVEEACLTWMRNHQWEVQVIESKATYNPHAGRYIQNSSVKTGNPDIQGIMPDGTTVAVELKAKGRLSTFLSDRSTPQRDFIIKRIHMNAFAAVVDSTDLLEEIYTEWLRIKQIDPQSAKQYLLSRLPQPKKTP